MKIRILIIVLSLVLMSSLADAGLKISPEMPTKDQSIKLSYTRGSDTKLEMKIYAYIYSFSMDDALPTASRISMLKSNTNSYDCEFTVPDDIVFAMIKVGDSQTFDNNMSNFWDFVVVDSGGKPIFGALQKQALSYLGNFPVNCSRNINFVRALEQLEKELQNHPSNKVAEIGIASLKLDLRKITKEEFDGKIQNIYNEISEYDDENLVIAMTNALKAAGQTDKTSEMETIFIQRHPFSKMSEDKQMKELQNADSFTEFERKVFQFLERFPNSNNKEKIWLALMKAYKSESSLSDFINKIKSNEKIPSDVYTQLAIELADQKRSSDIKADGEVMFYFNKAIEGIKFNINSPKPKFYTDDEWEIAKQPKLANIYILIADAQESDGKYAEATDYLLNAKKLLGENTKFDLYDDLTDLQLKNGKTEDAYNTAGEAILNSESSTFTDSVFKENYFKFTKSQKGYELFLDSLTESAKTIRLRKLAEASISVNVELPELITSDGAEVNLNSFKNKILVLNFWSSWCEPCKESFPALMKLNELYNGNTDVKILNINVWEKSKNRKKEVKKFLIDYDIEIPVYVDAGNLFPGVMSFSGLPARIYIDKNSNIRFREFGFDGEERLIRDAQDIIEFLMSGK